MKKTLKLVLECAFSVFAVAMLFVALSAWAQPVGLPTTDQQGLELAALAWQFIVDKKYAAAIGPGLTFIVWLFKKFDQNIPKWGPQISAFMDKPLVSFGLPFGVSAIGGFVTALSTGHSFVDALGAVYVAASSAITTYIGLKKIDEQFKAGDVAAAGVDSKGAAIDELKKESK